jgi:aldehyde:ferredoxin oxidoreductase
MKLLRIDLTRKRANVETWEDELNAGRLLTVEFLSREADPGCDPLGPENPLVLATGPLAGWGVSCGGRLSVGAKSPLTGGIKESNAGGEVADILAGLGYRAVVLEGALPEGEPGLIAIEGGDDDETVRFLQGAEYEGLQLEETARRLRRRFGKEYTYVAIGPAGEMQMPAAALCVSDVRGNPFRFAARGGLGAVMGSKGIKALLIRKVKSSTRPRSKAFRAAVSAFHRVINANARVEVLRQYGTPSTVMLVQSLGGLPTRNFRQGAFEEAEGLSGEAVHDLIVARQGEGTPTERCMATCIIQCSNVYPDAGGKRLVAPIEYETLAMCGSNLGIGDPDVVARLNRLCNELGLDTIEIGAALGVAADAGLWSFGDGTRAIGLVEEIGEGTLLGRLLGQGCETVGRVLGVRRIPAVKGQGMSAYDPRAIKGTGVTFATNPMGGDHTAGLTVFAPVDHHRPEGQVQLSRDTQLTRAAYDALGLCVFLLGSTGSRPELVTEMLNAAYGTQLAPTALAEIGQRVIDLERAFNHGAGLTQATDRLPQFFLDEPLPPHGERFDVQSEELASIWERDQTGVEVRGKAEGGRDS